MLTDGEYSMSGKITPDLIKDAVKYSKVAKRAGVVYVKDQNIEMPNTMVVSVKNIPIGSTLNETKRISMKYYTDLASLISNELDSLVFGEILSKSKYVHGYGNVQNNRTSGGSSLFQTKLTKAIDRCIIDEGPSAKDCVIYISDGIIDLISYMTYYNIHSPVKEKFITDGIIDKLYGYDVEIVPENIFSEKVDDYRNRYYTGTSSTLYFPMYVNLAILKFPAKNDFVRIRLEDAHLKVVNGACEMVVRMDYEVQNNGYGNVNQGIHTNSYYSKENGYFSCMDAWDDVHWTGEPHIWKR